MSDFLQPARRYQEFRRHILFGAGNQVSEPLDFFPDLTEIDLQAKWFGGEYGREFVAEGGAKIEVVQFGHWNRGAGPDFTEAAIRIDGELKQGAIEIDTEAMDWERHGHGANPNFDSVILHIFVRAPMSGDRFFTRDSQHREICQLKLTPDPSGDILPADRYPPEAFPGLCLQPLSRMTDTAVNSLLLAAAQSRLLEKFMRLLAISRGHNPGQALYQGIAEALGFRKNKLAMAVLAQRHPIATISKEEPILREARLFGAAGFLQQQNPSPEIPQDSVRYLRELWDSWWKIRAEVEPERARSIPWQMGRSRPYNHPQRRLGALVSMSHIWPKVAEIWEKPDSQVVKRFGEACKEMTHPYWQHHYTVQSAASKKPMQLIGQARLRDILGNVLLPWLVGQHGSDYWEVYTKVGGSDDNEKVRRARLRLFGEDEKRAASFSKKYFQQQGLLAVYTDFCLRDVSECQDCPFPEQLLQWKE